MSEPRSLAAVVRDTLNDHPDLVVIYDGLVIGVEFWMRGGDADENVSLASEETEGDTITRRYVFDDGDEIFLSFSA